MTSKRMTEEQASGKEQLRKEPIVGHHAIVPHTAKWVRQRRNSPAFFDARAVSVGLCLRLKLPGPTLSQRLNYCRTRA